MAYGRRRAAARVAGPGYAPHPGWRRIVVPGWRVLVDQAEAFLLRLRLGQAQHDARLATARAALGDPQRRTRVAVLPHHRAE